jgi:hypothetical protein
MRKPGTPPPRVAPNAPSVAVTVTHAPALLVTDAQISEIAASLGVKEDSEYVADVLDTLRQSHGREIAMQEASTRDRDIETLSSLARAMNGLNSNVLMQLAQYGVDLPVSNPRDVAAAAHEVAEGLKRIPKKRGRKSKTSRAVTIRRLAAIYTKATGRPAKISRTNITNQPTGRYFRFMRAATAPILQIKDSALAKSVSRAFGQK